MGDTKMSALPGAGRQKPDAPEAPASWPARGGASSRHGAISRQLFTYSHYKSWAERMRNSWQAEEEPTEEDTAVRVR